MSEPRRVYLHIHIPKCGGTSFNEVLWRNFRERLLMEYGRFNMLRPSAEEVEWSLSRNHWYRAVAGHKFHTRVHYQGRDHRVIAITFVRDPVQQFTSAFNYMLRTDYPNMATMAIAEAARWILEEAQHKDLLRPWFVRGQLNHLDPAHDLERIARLVEQGSLHIFPIERFAEACLVLGQQFPDDFRHSAFRIKNTSPRLQEADPEVEELVHEHRGLDFALHDLAFRHLDQELDRSFAPQELERARRRQGRRCRLLGSPLGEIAYVVGRFRDLSRQYLERRRWVVRG